MARAEMFQLRDYRADDLRQLCALDRQCFPKKVAYSVQTMRQTVSEKGAFTIVAEDQAGSVVGFVVAGRGSGRVGHIVTLDVACEYRGVGLGTRLMMAAEARLAPVGVTKIRLETATANTARSLFEKLNYACTGKIERYYPDGADAWVMEKVLVMKHLAARENLTAKRLP